MDHSPKHIGFSLIIVILSFVVSVLCALNELNHTLDDDGLATPCVDEGVEGRCVEPHHCFSSNPYIEGIVHPPNCTLTSGARGVCCTDCDLVTNASDAVLDGRGDMLWKTGDKSYDKCIEWVQQLTYYCHYRSYLRRELVSRPATARAAGGNATVPCYYYSRRGIAPVGGEDVVRGEFPHMVLLGYQDSQSPLDWYCSGALVSERFVLTAAHCLTSSLLGPVTEIAAGVLRRSDPAQYWHRYRVARAIPHPEYRPPSKYHDIALLETEQPVQFVDNIRPACLPAYVTAADYERRNTATGWGSLGHHRPLANTLQKVYLEQFSQAECEEQYPPHRHLRAGINHTTQMCYGHHDQLRDTCGGDSGGALQSDTGRPTCASTLLGVTSFGRECGVTLATAGVYVRVQHYLPWIESIVWA